MSESRERSRDKDDRSAAQGVWIASLVVAQGLFVAVPFALRDLPEPPPIVQEIPAVGLVVGGLAAGFLYSLIGALLSGLLVDWATSVDEWATGDESEPVTLPAQATAGALWPLSVTLLLLVTLTVAPVLRLARTFY